MSDTGNLRLLWWGRELACSHAARGCGRRHLPPAWGPRELSSKAFSLRWGNPFIYLFLKENIHLTGGKPLFCFNDSSRLKI